MPGDSFCGRLKLSAEWVIRLHYFCDEAGYRIFPFFIRLDPAAVNLGFLNCLEQVSLHPPQIGLVDGFGPDRPGPQKRLVEQVFFVWARCCFTVDIMFSTCIDFAPFVNPILPLARYLTEHGNPRSNILASLRIMRGRSKESVWRFGKACSVFFVKPLQAHAKKLRRSPDFVQSDKAVENVERSVFQSFGHDRTCALLKFQNKIELQLSCLVGEVFKLLQKQDVAQIIKNRNVDCRVAPLGCSDCSEDYLTIGL